MKKIILSFIVFATLFSCSKKEQYYGTWVFNGFSLSNPNYLKIDADSVSLSESGNHWNTYPVTIKSNSLTFLNHTFKTSISGDSLIFEESVYKKGAFKDPINVKLPKLKSYNFQSLTKLENPIFISLHKKLTIEQPQLFFNNKPIAADSLLAYYVGKLNEDIHSPLPQIILMSDGDVKMKNIESIFTQNIILTILKVYLINDINQEYDSQPDTSQIISKFHYHKLIFQPHLNPNYTNIPSTVSIDNMQYIISTTYLNTTKFIEKNKAPRFVFLINNEFYFGKNRLPKNKLIKKIEASIETNTPIILLYDLESTYKSYLEFVSMYKTLLNKERDHAAISLFNTSFESLNKDQQYNIRSIHPYVCIQQYSIPHFLSFEESPEENTEFPFKNVKEQVPEIYFEGLK